MKWVCLWVHDFGVVAVGDEEEIVWRISFWELDIDDLVVVANNEILEGEACVVDDSDVLFRWYN